MQWNRYYAHLGDADGAWRSQEKARGIRESIVAAHPNNRRAQLALSNSYVAIGDLMVERGELRSALTSYRRSLAIRQELLTSAPHDPRLRKDLVISFQRIGDTLGNPSFRNLGDAAGALDNFRRMQAINEALATEYPADQDAQQSVAIGYEKIGKALGATGDWAGALQLFRKEQAALASLAAGNSANGRFRRDLAIAYGNIGMALMRLGDLPGALENYAQTFAIDEQLAAIDPGNIAAKNDMARALNVLANTAAQAGRVADARGYRSRWLMDIKALADRPKAAANDLNEYAWDLLTCEAVELCSPTLARSYAERAADMTNREDANILDTLALALRRSGETAEAVRVQEKATSLRKNNSRERQDFPEPLDMHWKALATKQK